MIKFFGEIHNSIFVFREKEVSHNLKILALQNLKCHKNGQTCQENQNGKICVTMFLMNHQNNQQTKKVQWFEILSDGAFLSLITSIVLSPLHESFVNIWRYYDCNSNENRAVHVIQQPIPNIQFRIVFNQNSCNWQITKLVVKVHSF